MVSGIMSDSAGSLDGFAMRVERDGTVAWWRSFGAAGVVESTPHAAIGGSDLVLVGYASNGASGNDAFALRLRGDGNAIEGQLYASFDAMAQALQDRARTIERDPTNPLTQASQPAAPPTPP